MRKITFLFILSISILFLNAQNYVWTKVVNIGYPTGITFDNNDSLWYIVQGSGFFEKSGNQSINHSGGLITTNVVTISFDGNNTFWVGGYGGITKIDGTNYTGYNDTTGLMGHAVYQVISNNGTAWLVMESEGVSYFDGNSWIHYTTADGLSDGFYTSIDKKSNGDIVVSGFEYTNSNIYGAINTFSNSSWSYIDDNSGLNFNSIYGIVTDNQDDVWIVGDGIGKYDGTNFTVLVPDTFDSGYEFRAIIEDNHGNMIIGQNNGDVYIYDGTNLIPTNAPQIYSGRTQGIAKNSNGEIFVCLKDGIYKLTITTTSNFELSKNSIKVYPNPAQNYINIDCKDYKINNLEISDLLGKTVFKVTNNINKIDISNLNNGIYILSISTDKGIYKTKIEKTN